MNYRQLGSSDLQVSEISLGSWLTYGGGVQRQQAEACVAKAFEVGINFIDTANVYSGGGAEELLGEMLAGRPRDSYVLATKLYFPVSDTDRGLSREQVFKQIDLSLGRLRTDYVDLYQPTRVDPNVPIEDTIGAVSEMVKAGYVRHIGLSEASSETIRRAHAVHPIVALQIEYSIVTRGVEADILPALRHLGISLVAYGVFSRGLLTGHAPSRESASQGDIRAHFPRFQGENLKANQQVVSRLRAIAQEKKITVAQLAVAWMFSRGKDIVPLVGARRRDQLSEALRAMEVSFSAGELVAIEDAVPIGSIAGDRYGAEQMAALDSERPVSKSSKANS